MKTQLVNITIVTRLYNLSKYLAVKMTIFCWNVLIFLIFVQNIHVGNPSKALTTYILEEIYENKYAPVTKFYYMGMLV